jgi:hypothetical protein
MFQGTQCGLCVGVYDLSAAGSSISSISHLFSVTVSSAVVMVRYTLKQHVFVYGICVKYGSARKCRRKFQSKFRDE